MNNYCNREEKQHTKTTQKNEFFVLFFVFKICANVYLDLTFNYTRGLLFVYPWYVRIRTLSAPLC